MHCTLRTLTLMLLAPVPVAAPVWAQAPALLTHHGYLSQAGAAVEGSIAITFALYDTATDAQFFWSEEVIATCAGGYYTVVLGSQVALDAQRLAMAPALHLGLRIATDPELAPRLPVSSVPYALASDLAARAEIAHDLDCESCIAATEVAFSYAGSSAAGGPATALECQDTCVESAEIANGAVGTSKLADGSVTFEKLAPCPGGQVLRATGGAWACSNAIVIDGAGNVGIGTATPSERLQVAGNIDLSGMLAVRGGPRYTSASTAVADHGLVTFTHNLGYVPWCTWSSSNENSAVSMRSISGTQIQLIGWSPSLGQSTNVVVRCG